MIDDVQKILPVKVNGIPDFVKDEPYWVNWIPLVVDGKARKAPTHGIQLLHGQYWDNEGREFEDALSTMPASGGLGLLLSMSNSLACIDIDDCSVTDTRLLKILTLAEDAWCEYSPSGHGVHIWGYLPQKESYLLEGRKTIGYRGKEYEWYGSGRCITVTGHYICGNGLVDLTAAVKFVDGFRPKSAECKQAHIIVPVATCVEEILKKAFMREPELSRMYYNGHNWKDESAEDFKFCQRMWFWLGGHGSDAIERVFRNSALYRKSKGVNYVSMTVSNAAKRWNGKYYGSFSR